ncbi:hypothetical protein [Solirhodobacter olei]|uniref:hypothetical protein n=1 Tax=Solirhodobacter olei TaxID=2493082 RepID=UPI000FD7BDCB|nr:hypothetical protein [Solirhodobacter olei]
MAEVVVLYPVERVTLDPARLSSLCRVFGMPEAERILCRGMTEIALQMTALVRLYNSGDVEGFGRGLARLGRLADHTGFTGLSQAAGGVADCLGAPPRWHCDTTALAATWARLMRLAAHAMSSAGGLRGLSG